MCFEFFRKIYKKIKEAFEETRESKGQEFIKEALPKSVEIFPLDAMYFFANREEFKKHLEDDKTDYRKYKPEKYDCENFAFSLKAHMDFKYGINTVGLVIDYQSGHSYNVVIWPDKTYSLIEPQSDEIFSYEERDERFYRFDGSTVIV